MEHGNGGRSLRQLLHALPGEAWKTQEIFLRPIQDEEDLWYATVECRLKPGQEEFVNPAGFSIGRAYLNPEEHVPCVICKADGERIGYLVLRTWIGGSVDAASWSYYLDAACQGQGFGKKAAMLAVHILKTAGIQHLRLSTEAGNVKAQRLYTDIGFMKLDELDGDDLVFGLSISHDIERRENSFL